MIITPPDATAPISDVPGLRADAVCAAASIAEVADALKRLPSPAPLTGSGDQDLPWWVRPPQESPPTVAQSPQDTAVLATTPLPAFGAPIIPPGSAPTETLDLGEEEPSRRRFALTGRQARLASIAAVVVAVAATAIAVGLNSPSSSSSTNTAATSGRGGGNTAPFGNSNGSNGSNGVSPFNGQGNGSENANPNGQGNDSTPRFGVPGAPFDDHDGIGNRQQEFQKFLTCLKQNGVSVDPKAGPFFDPTDPKLRTALRQCAAVLPFRHFHDRDGNSASGDNGNGSHST